MLYVFRRASSSGARNLAEALNAKRFRGDRTSITQVLNRGDAVVCWGEALPPIAGVEILNGRTIRSKYQDAVRLTEAGVPTIEVRNTKPITVATVDPAVALFNQVKELAADFADLTDDIVAGRPLPLTQGVETLTVALRNLKAQLFHPAPAPRDDGEWLPRINSHVGGNDLLDEPDEPDFWAKKLDFTKEFRIHSFMNHSLRAGIKAPREGEAAHPWIRSWDAGWRIKYDGISSKRKHRELAHAAVEALGLQFGAVDIGEKADGSLVVLEVNRAPGIEHGTLDAYARAIQGCLGA